MKALILSLILLTQSSLSWAEESPFHQSQPNLSLRIRPGKTGPNIQWLTSKDPKVKIGHVLLKVPKSDLNNCTGDEVTFEYEFPGILAVNTTALGSGYPEKIEIPMKGRTSTGKLKPGRRIHVQVRLLVQETPTRKVSFDSFLLKGEKGKCP